MSLFTGREELEDRFGQQRVLDLFDDERSGGLTTAGLARLNERCSEADEIVIGALIHKGWSRDELRGLSRDRQLRRAASQIAMQLGGERRAEFTNDQGRPIWDEAGERARKFLSSFARGEQRSRLEDSVGKNDSLRGRVSESTPRTIFGRDPADPNDLYGDGRGF